MLGVAPDRLQISDVDLLGIVRGNGGGRQSVRHPRRVRHAIDARNYLIVACTVMTDVPETLGP